MLSNRRFIKIYIFCLIFTIFTSPAWAVGKQDLIRDYEFGLIENFESLITDLDSSLMTAEQAKSELQDIRQNHKQDYNDLSGILDAMIDGVAEKRLTVKEAIANFNNLMRERIREYNEEKSRMEDRQRDKKEEKQEGNDNPPGNTNN